jgi:hypothetical protein
LGAALWSIQGLHVMSSSTDYIIPNQPRPKKQKRKPQQQQGPDRPPDPRVVATERGIVIREEPPKPQREGRGKPQQARAPPLDQLAAYSIASFCAAHCLSESMFFKLRAMGLAPAVFKIGSRTLISKEAAAAWRAQREAETAASTDTTTANTTT